MVGGSHLDGVWRSGSLDVPDPHCESGVYVCVCMERGRTRIREARQLGLGWWRGRVGHPLLLAYFQPSFTSLLQATFPTRQDLLCPVDGVHSPCPALPLLCAPFSTLPVWMEGACALDGMASSMGRKHIEFVSYNSWLSAG